MMTLGDKISRTIVINAPYDGLAAHVIGSLRYKHHGDMIAAIGPDDPTTQQVLERTLAQEEARAKSPADLLRKRASTRGLHL